MADKGPFAWWWASHCDAEENEGSLWAGSNRVGQVVKRHTGAARGVECVGSKSIGVLGWGVVERGWGGRGPESGRRCVR